MAAAQISRSYIQEQTSVAEIPVEVITIVGWVVVWLRTICGAEGYRDQLRLVITVRATGVKTLNKS